MSRQTVKERIAAYLQRHPEGVDDDMLAKVLNLSARQQANSQCRQLAQEGLVERRVVHGKIHNFWIGGEKDTHKDADEKYLDNSTSQTAGDKGREWFWEGNVQDAVVRYLQGKGYRIRAIADTASHQTGKDIVAERDGKRLWITVKGYPRGTARTHPSTQAGHWFKQAIFDVLEYRGESREVALGVALPDYPRYRKLAKRIEWLKPVAKFVYFWVSANGDVTPE